MFKNIRDKKFSEKKMFCNGLTCLIRNTKSNNLFPNLLYLVVLNKIILVVFLTNAISVVVNWLLDSFYIVVEENTKLRKVSASSIWLYRKVEMFQEPGICCKNFIKPEIPFKILAFFCENIALSCKMLQEIFQGSWKLCLTQWLW